MGFSSSSSSSPSAFSVGLSNSTSASRRRRRPPAPPPFDSSSRAASFAAPPDPFGASTTGLFGSSSCGSDSIQTTGITSPLIGLGFGAAPIVFGSSPPPIEFSFPIPPPSSSFTGCFGSTSGTTVSSSKSPSAAASQAQSTAVGDTSSCSGCGSNDSSIHLAAELSGPGVSNEHKLLRAVSSPAGVEGEDKKGDTISKDWEVVDGVSAPTVTNCTAKEMTPLASQVHSFTTPKDMQQLTDEVVNFENVSSESEVLNRNHELGSPPSGGSVPLESPPVSYVKLLSVESTLYPEKATLIEQIFEKHGDITKGSILKSIEANAAFVHLVAEVVERLRNYNLEGSVDAHELEVMQKWTEDAGAVGFRVEWLQRRIEKAAMIRKYQDKLMQVNEMSEKVSGAMKALMEMELQELVLKRELDLIKSEMDRDEDCGSSNLCEGLI